MPAANAPHATFFLLDGELAGHGKYLNTPLAIDNSKNTGCFGLAYREYWMSSSRRRNPRSVISDETWIDTSQTAFGKRAVTGIAEWVRSVSDPRFEFVKSDERECNRGWHPGRPANLLIMHFERDFAWVFRQRMSHQSGIQERLESSTEHGSISPGARFQRSHR